MTCVCGHSDDLHEYEEIDEGIWWTPCTGCSCEEFCEDIDRDELETE